MVAVAKYATAGSNRRVQFRCPGCEDVHWATVESLDGEVWGFNGDLERPTFTPSILLRGRYADPPVTPENFEPWKREPWEQVMVDRICHSFVTDGRIQFLGDCTHELAGQTVNLPPWEQE